MSKSYQQIRDFILNIPGTKVYSLEHAPIDFFKEDTGQPLLITGIKHSKGLLWFYQLDGLGWELLPSSALESAYAALFLATVLDHLEKSKGSTYIIRPSRMNEESDFIQLPSKMNQYSNAPTF